MSLRFRAGCVFFPVMHRRTWQREETEVTRALVGSETAQRRGADTRDGPSGLDDCSIDGLSVEVKLRKALGYEAILSACKQAEGAAAPGELPIAVVRTPGASKQDRLVVLRLPVFVDWFGTFGGDSS